MAGRQDVRTVAGVVVETADRATNDSPGNEESPAESAGLALIELSRRHAACLCRLSHQPEAPKQSARPAKVKMEEGSGMASSCTRL